MSRRKALTGLTLMEMLVTLAITAMIASVLWQALAQTARVERLLESGSLRGLDAALRLEWARMALEASVAANEADPDRFKGDEKSLSAASAQVPGWPSSHSAPFALELRHDAARGRGELVLRVGHESITGAPNRVLILEWEGAPGSLRYLDEEGTWHDTWPARSLSAPTRSLPLAVAVRTGSPQWPLIIAALRSTSVARPTRAQVEQF